MSNIEILKSRKSVRSFGSSPISDSLRRTLQSEATFVNSHESGLSFRVVFDDDAPFRGIGRSYGMFRGVNNYLAVVIDPTFPHTMERTGYFAQQWVMEALKIGISTCFVGGTFSASHVETMVEVYEKIPFVIAFGTAEEARTPMVAKITMAMMHNKKRTPRDFFDGSDSEFESAQKNIKWLETALEAVACAPSALNKQPVRLKPVETAEGWTVSAHTINPGSNAIELGIAKFNVAFAVGGSWEWGENALFLPE